MTNYARGRDFEYEVMHKLALAGYTCMRAAGSHGKIDVIAMKNTETRLIQCKVGIAIPSAELRELISWARENNRGVEVWHKVPRKYVEISIYSMDMPVPLRNRVALKDF